MSNEGLRLKKKIATRQALAEVAFQLALECGVEGFVIEDVVKRAGYSRRTFANHYSCKEEAIASSLTMSDFPIEPDFESEGLTPLSTIEFFIKRSFTINKLNRLYELLALSKHSPTLKLYVIGALKEIQDFARQRISEEFGDNYSSEYYYLLIGAVFGALMPVLDGSIDVRLPEESEHQEIQDFEAYMNVVFSKLREGFK